MTCTNFGEKPQITPGTLPWNYHPSFGQYLTAGYNNHLYKSICLGLSTLNKRPKGELRQEDRLSGIDNRSHSSDNPNEYSLEKFHQIIDIIKYMKHTRSTRRKYHDIWINFNKFLLQFDRMPTTWEDRIYVYMAHLVDNRKQTSTIKTYLSAIRQILTSDGVELKEDKELLSSMMKTSKIQNDKLYIRLPIKFNLLQLILRMVDKKYSQSGQHYLASLMKAMFASAYYGLLRISEITTSPHQIKAKNFHLARNKNKATFILDSSKTHSTRQKPQKVVIPGIAKLGKNCPIQLIEDYLKKREVSTPDTPFFILKGAQPVTPYMFRTVLKNILTDIGVNCALYDSHSFRQGRCVDLYKLGYSLTAVKQAGRWKSSAIMNYLKIK